MVLRLIGAIARGRSLVAPITDDLAKTPCQAPCMGRDGVWTKARMQRQETWGQAVEEDLRRLRVELDGLRRDVALLEKRRVPHP